MHISPMVQTSKLVTVFVTPTEQKDKITPGNEKEKGKGKP